MNQNDIDLKKTAANAGIALLIFLLLFFAAFAVFKSFLLSLIANFIEGTLGTVISEIISGLIYATVFITPALIFARLNKSVKQESAVRVSRRFSAKRIPFIVMATVAISLACAYVNSWLCTLLGIAESETETAPLSLVGFLLLVFTTAVVPAICEEFFFRKTLMGAFLPYGEGFAIISTAILFGLMHQNIFQIFYTTMAGILLGLVYAKTRSYLCVFLIHFVNNFISVIQTLFLGNLKEEYITAAIISLISVVFVLGAGSAIILMIKEKNKPDVYSTGSFSQILLPCENFVERNTDHSPVKTLFLSPSVLIFTILAGGTCLLQFFM